MNIVSDTVHEIKYVDQSSLCTFERCPAKYFFSRILGLSPHNDNMLAANYGTCIHAAMPFCHSADLGGALKAFETDWARFGHGEDNAERNRGRAFDTITTAIATRSGKTAPYTPVSYDTIPIPEGAERFSKNEIPFAIDIGASLPALGRIDAIVKWHQDGDRLWPLDYKTSAEISTRWFDSFNFSPQSCLYTLAASHVIGLDAKGIIIEAIRTSKVTTELCFKPIFVYKSQISDFVNWACWKVDEMLAMNDSKTWYKKPTGCSAYPCHYCASHYCDYKPLCEVPDYHTMLNLYKTSEPFHPFKVA